jgi:hypothetical protein
VDEAASGHSTTLWQALTASTSTPEQSAVGVRRSLLRAPAHPEWPHLRHHCHCPPQALLAQLPHIHPIEQHCQMGGGGVLRGDITKRALEGSKQAHPDP